MFGEIDLQPDIYLQLVLQAGALGILAILAWNVPRFLKEIKQWRKESETQHLSERQDWFKERLAMRTEYAVAFEAQRKEATANLRDIAAIFREETRNERSACEKHFQTLADAMSRGNEATIAQARTIFEQVRQHAERNQQWMEMLRKENDKHDAQGS